MLKRILNLFAIALICCSTAFAADEIQHLEELHRQADEQIALNNFRGAMTTLQEILLLEPNDETAYANMGLLYLLFSDHKKAKEAFQNALSIDPENETALAGLAKIKDPDASSYLQTDPDPPVRSGPENSAGPKD